MKKSISLLIALTLIFTVTACDGEEIQIPSDSDTQNTTAKESVSADTTSATSATTQTTAQDSVVYSGEWDSVSEINAERFIAADPQTGLFGILDNNGKTICEFVYEKLEKHGKDLLAGYKNDGLFLLNQNGELYIDIAFESADFYSDKDFYVSLGNIDYSINMENGKFVINSVSVLKPILRGNEAIIHIGVDNNELGRIDEMLELSEKAAAFLVALGEDYSATLKQTRQSPDAFTEHLFNSDLNLNSIFQIIVFGEEQGDAGEVFVQIILYAVFDDTDSKRDIGVGFIKTESGEYEVYSVYQAA